MNFSTTTKQLLKLRYNGNVAQYGWAYADGSVKECDYDGCHSQILAYDRKRGVVQAFSFGPAIPKLRLDYIFDPQVSPWRSLLNQFGMTRQDIEDGSPFIYNDLTFDANLIVNHMVSVRWPAEQIWSYNLWERLVLNGVHPAVADLLSGLCRCRPCEKLGEFKPDAPQFTTYQYMHSNFIALDCDKQYAENFVNGVMAGGNGFPFMEAEHKGNDYAGGSKPRGYKPIVGAFGHFSQVSYLDQMKGVYGEYMQFLADTYCDAAKQPRDFNHLVEIGKQEQVRFNLNDWAPGQRAASEGVPQTPNGVELSQSAIDKYEGRRSGKSDWGYVQQKRGSRAHAF